MKIGDKRKNFILSKIQEEASITVAALAAELDVSEITIRRYLAELENEGLLKRVHGGAVSSFGRGYEPPFSLRSTQATQEKIAIAQLAASLIKEGDTVAFDSGSTVYEVAKQIADFRGGLTVITPSIRIINLLMRNPDIRLIIPGGIVRSGEESIVGELTRHTFKQFFVDKLFLGVGCLDSEVGLTEYNWEDTIVKQAMIASAKEVYLAVDSTKFESVAFAKIAEIDCLHMVITDQAPPEKLANKFKEANVTLCIAHVAHDKKIKAKN